MITHVGAQFIAPSPAGTHSDVVASSHAVTFPEEGAMNCAPTRVSPHLGRFIDSVTLDLPNVGAQFIAPSSGGGRNELRPYRNLAIRGKP